jgi:CubicO group peptidase (beta-lactamase class C family)
VTRRAIAAPCLALIAATGPAIAQEKRGAELVGLWEAVRTFGPEVKGPLLLIERDGKIVADIAGFSVPVTARGAHYAFELPDGKGSFRGRKLARRDEIKGFWIQPGAVALGQPYASPITLRRETAYWRGEVEVLEDRFSFYLPVTRTQDGTLATYLRNPEQNIGIFTQVKSVVLQDGKVSLVGNRRGQTEQKTLFEGRIEEGRLSIQFATRGGEYQFRKVDGELANAFNPRGRAPAPYRYTKPVHRDDGWPTATVDEVGISRAAIEAFIQRLIETPMSSVNASQIHSVLIARHGKLVLEEYFHGYHRDRPHDTRSAGKSLAATLIGAAMHAGIEVSPATPVYQTMVGRLPTDLDARKRAMKLEHLLTMTGGHFCDDSNPNAPGNEDVMQSQEKERDWYRFILALPMDRTPGEKIVYCSIDAHLAGGVLAKAAGEPLPELFDRLVARPLRMGPYYLNLAPTGEAYMGGGAYLLPRDFLKVAQLMVNEGTWAGRRIVSREWALKSTSAMRDLTPRQQYGYLWNSAEYPYRGRKVRAFFAGGNGGQIFMGIPELGLAIAFTGGNYSDATLFIPQRVLVPEQILPAVE